MKKVHKNKIVVNDTPYHLYVMYDHQYHRIYKFGISGATLLKNGQSSRLNEQLNLHNRPEDWVRFTGRILEVEIRGIIRAYQREDAMIDMFRAKHKDSLPKGNTGHLYLGKKYAYLLVAEEE